MSDLISNLGLIASQNAFLAYFIVYLSTIFFGNISAFASFWFISQGYLGIWGIPLLILTIFLSDLTGDLLWYSFGLTLRETRLGNWIKRRLPWHNRIERAVIKNGKRWLFLSKFLYASSFPVIFSIGWTGMPFKRFIKNSLLSILAWLPVLIGLAYALTSGLSPLRAVSFFKEFEIAFFVALALFLLADYLLAKVVARYFQKDDEGS